MPELPEVRTVSRALNESIKNKIIKNVKINRDKTIVRGNPKNFALSLRNVKIEKIKNIGKWIIYFLDNKKVILSHLRMTGKYFYYEEKRKPLKHAHIIFSFEDGSQLQYQDYRGFGTFEIKDKSNYLTEKPLSKLSKEPQDIDDNIFWLKLQKSRRAIKTLILDQSIVLGFGNIYVDETLWKLKIHPQTPGNKITKKEAKNILKYGAEIMDLSTSLGGSTVSTYSSLNNVEGTFAKHFKVFRKNGEPCPRCRTKIIKTKVNGRGTHTCPKCQKNRFG